MKVSSPERTITCTTGFDSNPTEPDFRITIEFEETRPENIQFVNLTPKKVQIGSVNKATKLPATVYVIEGIDTVSYAFSAGRKPQIDHILREEDVTIGIMVNNEIVEKTTVSISC